MSIKDSDPVLLPGSGVGAGAAVVGYPGCAGRGSAGPSMASRAALVRGERRAWFRA
ncbi:hypothetical protein MLP_48620 [Microlunatus phosphovorus NM-1]|uniref:Uncharacterized protein n=1 Tax=Microlunatus phosphovorus (strain ATCC 700054 / DSM 10555 / JCM 9379 / NBRC 101784 / NCIMB 13414 / VKM Ac-1990 / NM-1) TaxID=1032480 RepID=F5XFD8_MICPN|nr:hypothetical protein MLP_48620 [Microlunatus phosphovorus NM-1]